ncbi:MAG: glycosyltransferase family 39 protein [Bacteroidetes bacterium]|nr:glycosyltransferase family 39 protein [Bacteroidota bacterium]
MHISFFQIFGYDFRNIIGDLGDSRFIVSIIEYNYQWLCGNYSGYWDGFFMFPDKEVISYSDNLLGITPFYSIFRLFGADNLMAFQLLILLCHILNYITSYYVFNKLTNNKYAASAGAFIFAFSLIVNGIHNHPQFIFRFFVPLVFYFLYQYLNTKNVRDLLLCTFFIVLQFYLGVYLGYFTFFFGALFALCFLVFNFQKPELKMIIKRTVHLLLTGLGAGVLLGPMFYFYYKRNQITGYYTDFNEVLETVPQVSSYFKAFPGAVAWHFLSSTPVQSKYEWFHFLFPGILIILSFIFAFFLAGKGYNKKLLLTLIVMSVCCFILTTNFNTHCLYDNILLHIPGFKAIRVVSRLVLVWVFFMAWTVSISVTYLATLNIKGVRVVLILLPFLLVFDNYCKADSFVIYPKSVSQERTNSIKNKILSTLGYKNYLAFAYIPSGPDEAYKIQIDAMLVAVELKTKTINGYSSSCHGQFGPVWEKHDSLSVATWLQQMKIPQEKVLFVR